MNRWANEVKIDNNTAREIAIMYESLELVHAKIPRKEKPKLEPVIVANQVVKKVGLAGSMK